jgi:ABC-type cobalamin/Fe3+-siderophores transport system ATPase subunit
MLLRFLGRQRRRRIRISPQIEACKLQVPPVFAQHSASSRKRYHSLVIRRFYVHNFRCLENFELPVSGLPSVLLIGNNGSGKTTVRLALEILQKIARGTNRVDNLVKHPKDFAHGRTDVPIRFEIEVELNTRVYEYAIAFEFVEGFKELGVLEEKLAVDGKPVYARAQAHVHLSQKQGALTAADYMKEAQFRIDWRLVALPIIQEQSQRDPVFIFKQWLAGMLILGPIPSLILGDSGQESLQPNVQVTDFGAWWSGLLAYSPAAFTEIDAYLKQLMPDLKDIKNPLIGKDSRSLEVQFSAGRGSPVTLESLTVPFEDLSDGEKCFMICALVLATNQAHGPLFCFWDEPDNYLALSEVGHFVVALRKAFQSGGQFIATSHNPEAISRFSDENTLVLQRRNHLEPTIVRKLDELHIKGDLIGALIRGDVGP